MALTHSASQEIAVHVSCGVCGSERHEIYREGWYSAHDRRFDLVRCAECGVLYVNPRPRTDWHQELLQSPEYLERGYGGGLLEKGYFDRRDDWLDEFDRELERLEPQLGYVGRLLEFGAGGGYFCEAARRRGWQVQALENRKAFADYAEVQFPLPVYRGALDEAPFQEGSFDLAVLKEALTLCADPRAVVAQLFRWIRPGGNLLLTVPSYLNSPLHRGLTAGKRLVPRGFLGSELTEALQLEPRAKGGLPYQLYHFHRASLERLLIDAGWQVERVEATAPKPDFLFRRVSLRPKERVLKASLQVSGWMMRARLMPASYLWILARKPQP